MSASPLVWAHRIVAALVPRIMRRDFLNSTTFGTTYSL